MSDPDPFDPATWGQVPEVCGSCIAWKPGGKETGDQKAMGACQLRGELGRIAGDLPKCDRYMPRGSFKYDPTKATGTRRKRSKVLTVVRHTKDGEQVQTTPKKPIVHVRAPAPKEIDLGKAASVEVVREALVEMIRDELPTATTELHSRYRGGMVEIRAPKEKTSLSVSAERFHRILDELQFRLLLLDEAFSKKKLEAEVTEAVSRIRGTLTTFNVLFEDKTDYFRS